MFDFGFSEMLLAGVVALIVLGPERLPKVARSAGLLLGRLQTFVSGVKAELVKEVEGVDFASARQELQSAAAQFREEFGQLKEGIGSPEVDLPAWERLPEMKTPADFAEDLMDAPLPLEDKLPSSRGFQATSVAKRAMQRRRSVRPRVVARPRLRVRKR